MDSVSVEGSSEFSAMEHYESLISTADAELLKRAWRNEKAAPEILQFEAALVQRSREQIQLREGTVEESMTSSINPRTISLYQMELDRTLFLLRLYLRTRLQKIEKYVHIDKTTEMWISFLNKNRSLPKVPEPQLDIHVICRANRSLGAFQLHDRGEENPLSLDTGYPYAMRYNSIKPLVYRGQIDLL